MPNKILIEAADTLEDMAWAADWKTETGNRAGFVRIRVEQGEKMQYLAAKLRELQSELICKKVGFGTYECCEDTKHGFAVDSCLFVEVNKLVEQGVKTIGCCCGHEKKEAYIQVAPEYIESMKKLDYEQLPLDEAGNGQWCFKPKTVLP